MTLDRDLIDNELGCLSILFVCKKLENCGTYMEDFSDKPGFFYSNKAGTKTKDERLRFKHSGGFHGLCLSSSSDTMVTLKKRATMNDSLPFSIRPLIARIIECREHNYYTSLGNSNGIKSGFVENKPQ